MMRQAIQALPHEHFIYFGDTARVPYGDKSHDTIVRYSIENTSFLLSHKIKLLVVACNTASAYAIEHLRQKFSIPIIDVIEPAVEQAVQQTKEQKIAVLGTKATISSGIYQKRIAEKLPKAEVLSLACPLLVPLVEENFLTHPATRMILREYLLPVKEHRIDTLILGCTHYPLLSDLIDEELGGSVTILNSAQACTKEVVERLEREHLKTDLFLKGKREYYVSDDPEKFRGVGESFLGISIDRVELRSR